MKLVKQFLILLYAVSAYSGQFLSKRFIDYSTLSSECQKQIKSSTTFEQCMIDPLQCSIEEQCPTFMSKECLNFYDNPYSVISKCKGEEGLKEALSESEMTYKKYQVQAMCSHDGNGEKCPVAKVYQDGLPLKTDIVKQSCESKACYTKLYNYCDIIVKVAEELNIDPSTAEVFSVFKTIMEGEECTSKIKNDIDDKLDDKLSDAKFNAKINYILTLSLTLLLILIFKN